MRREELCLKQPEELLGVRLRKFLLLCGRKCRRTSITKVRAPAVVSSYRDASLCQQALAMHDTMWSLADSSSFRLRHTLRFWANMVSWRDIVPRGSSVG